MGWLFPGKEVLIESRCLDCGDPIRVRVRDGDLLEATPDTLVGYIELPIRRWGEVSNAYL